MEHVAAPSATKATPSWDDASAPDPEYSSMLGKRLITLSKWSHIKAAYWSKDLERGAVNPSNRLPFFIMMAYNVIFHTPEGWFFGTHDDEGQPSRIARMSFTVKKLTVGPEVAADAQEVANLMKSGDMRGARIKVINHVLLRFVPDLVVNDAFLKDVDTVYGMSIPSLSWINPLSWKWSADAKSRLLNQLGGHGEYFHHLMATSAWWDLVLQSIPSDGFRTKLQEKSRRGELGVLVAFTSPVPEVYRVVKNPTTLGGILQSEITRGTIVKFQLQGPGAIPAYRDQRLLGCCAQRLITEFTKVVIETIYTGTRVVLAPSSPNALIVDLTALLG